VEVSGFDPHLGWHPQGNGQWYYGLSIENGRVKDEGTLRLRTALRTLVERYRPALRLTPLQDILLCDLDPAVKGEIEQTLAEFGVLRPDQISPVQRYSMACPAIPTCGLALSEAERSLPRIIDQLEAELKRLGLENEKLSVRMTGCPNGCARPYQSDIGLVGRSGDKYTVFVGGNTLGTHLNFMLKDLVPFAEVVPTLLPLLEHFAEARQPGEGFGDFCRRLGAAALQALLPESKEKPATETRRREGEAPAEPRANGDAHRLGNGHAANGHNHGAGSALGTPETRLIPLTLREPAVTSAPTLGTNLVKQKETFWAGPPGEEQPDYTLRYNTDGSVRATEVYYYGNDLRAAEAHKGEPLYRKAVYRGRVDPGRLHAARKVSDTVYVGSVGHERRDLRVLYHADGRVARTVVYFYAGEARAAEAPSGAAVTRHVAYEGTVS
jgi:dissimilatory sulfite reductase (desulfoviridin) alpha/beta subunit